VRELLDIINSHIEGRGVEIIDERTKGQPVKIGRL
jgi:hypothetical protein